jgi:TonB family protein
MKSLLLIVVVVAVTFSVAKAQEDNYRGVELYKEGKYAEPLKALRFAVADIDGEKDPELWNYLGLACEAQNDINSAAAAFEKASKLAPLKPAFHANLARTFLLLGQKKKAGKQVDETLKLDPHDSTALMIRATVFYDERQLDEAERDVLEAISNNYERSDGYLLASKVLTARLERGIDKMGLDEQIALMERAKAILRTGIERCKGADDCGALDEEYGTFVDFIDYFSTHRSAGSLWMSDSDGPTGPDVIPLKITFKPRPGYSDRARQAGTQGRIKLAVLFGAHGKVARALVLKGLGDGLDEQALIAARKIGFEPMKRNGKPVSVVKTLEYIFSIY